MQRKKGFTLIELLVVISIIALLIGILLPALGAARRQARKMQNSTQIRGIHQQLVVFSNGNSQFYPGRTTSGANKVALAASATQYGYAAPAGVDDQNAAALAILLNSDAFAPDYLISPLETPAAADPKAPAATELAIAPPKSTTVTINPRHCSYAFISWADVTTVPSRRDEWFSTQNGLAPVVSDRAKVVCSNLPNNTSIHVTANTNNAADWEGHIAWNDNSTRYEGSAALDALKVKIGNATATAASTDDLFAVDAGTGVAADAGAFQTY